MNTITDKTVLENNPTIFKNDNIIEEINKIINSIPNVKPIEKIRYIYIKLGQLFSYDYRVAYNNIIINNKNIDLNNYVERYQTCIEISTILSKILNTIDGVESKIIERKANLRGVNGDNHLANEVTVQIDNNTYETYLLDLTLDLYLIQNNCRTIHFGYETAIDKNYDIIPHTDTYLMDKKLDLNYHYKDFTIESFKDFFRRNDFSNMSNELLIEKKLEAINSLLKPTVGYHEGKQFLNLLFIHTLNCNCKEYSLYKENYNNLENIKTIYKIELDGYYTWIVYSNNIGIQYIKEDVIIDMLNNNWKTKSNSLLNELDNTKKI